MPLDLANLLILAQYDSCLRMGVSLLGLLNCTRQHKETRSSVIQMTSSTSPHKKLPNAVYGPEALICMQFSGSVSGGKTLFGNYNQALSFSWTRFFLHF